MSVYRSPYEESYPPSLWLGPDPHIDALVPNTGSAAAGAITVQVNGTDFDATSKVEIDQVEQVTTFVNPTQLTVSYDPATTGAKLFTVRRGSQESNSVPFTVTALAAAAAGAGTTSPPESPTGDHIGSGGEPS